MFQIYAETPVSACRTLITVFISFSFIMNVSHAQVSSDKVIADNRVRGMSPLKIILE